MQEEDLIKASQRGDTEAFTKLVELHDEKVYLFILKKSRNEDIAREVTQVAWTKAWKKIDSFRGDCKFSSWICRIAFNFFHDHYRKNKRFVYTEDLLTPDSTSPADSFSGGGGTAIRWLENAMVVGQYKLTAEPKALKGLCMNELREEIEKAKNKLSPEHKEVVDLALFQGLEYQEAADIIGCPLGTVMSRLFYARKQMQKELRKVKYELSI